MSNQTTAISTIDETGNGLILQIDRRPDRFAHVLLAVKNGVEHLLLTSVEGTDKQVWPTSPPLQDFSVEEQIDGNQVSRQVLLAVGMAGTSHWSASFVTDPANRSIEFDIACRVKTTPVFLGSTYEFVNEAVSESDYYFRFENLRVQMKSLAQNGHASFKENRVSFLAECPQIKRDTTIRWKYRIELLV